jgi:hypothetical protein
MINLKTQTLLLCFILFFTIHSYSQVIWNEKSFALTKDVATPENMNGALPISFAQTGNFYSSGMIAPLGFTFNFGLKTYTSFYVSPRGFLKLGSPITSSNPALDTTVIAPLYSGAEWDAVYKISGAGAELKLVIEFSGDMQPTGQPTSFQVWLFPSGKIQFVYQQVNGYYGWQDLWNYKIFCQSTIMGNKVVASVKINKNDNTPVANYSELSIIPNNDTIYSSTRLTFQPDTIKPAKPLAISFSNVYPGCFSVNLLEGSYNESVVVLERADSGTNYKTEKYFYTNNPAGNTPYSYEQPRTQPNWTYNYRVYVSNGLKNSDTLYGTLQTPMPLISGIKKIPGDYPTITALLQDATCKHIGPDLIIELQNNYSFGTEKLPLYFNKELQNRLIQNITIRPAANATISMAGNTNGPLIYIDSVKHVAFDGRAGGIGTKRALTIYQQNYIFHAIQYANGADSGIINYCNILKKNFYNLTLGAIVIIPFDKNGNGISTSVNALHITNNFITTDANSTSNLISIQAINPGQAANILIDGNYFSRFRGSAISLNGISDGTMISNNHFFQPDLIKPDGDGACVSANNTGTITIDNNFFGGNSEKWGQGKMSLSSKFPYSIIDYRAVSDSSKAFIINNKFGNIKSTDSPDGSPHLLQISHGNVLIEGNSFGTADSTSSITYGGFMWPIKAYYGTKTIRGNFFSGLKADNATDFGSSNTSYVITAGFTDSLSINNNDIGGSDNILANTGAEEFYIIEASIVSGSVSISNNQIRGFSTTGRAIAAITDGIGYTDLVTTNLAIEGNNIHHLQSAGTVLGIDCLVNYYGKADISNNKIYALKTTGRVGGLYGPVGNIYGIRYSSYNYGLSPVDYIGQVNIYGNRIHSFESVRTILESKFTYNAINVECPTSRIYNNEIRLGIDGIGHPVDSLTNINGVSIFPSQNAIFDDHRHFIEHNSFYTGGKNLGGQFVKSFYNYQNVPDSNIINIRNNIFSLAALNDDVDPFIVPFMELGGTKAYTANNLWYSETIGSLPSALASFRQSCNCSWTDTIGNPKFINPNGDSANYTLRLGTGSKADSAGAVSLLGIDTDINGLKRMAYSPIDIGCYASTITISRPIFWSGTVSSVWENPANWVGGQLPDINTDVIINSGLQNYPVVSSNAICRSLTMKLGAILTVMTGYKLTIAF